MARKRNKEKIISQESGIPGINFGFMSGTGGGYKAPEDPLLVYERDKRKWQKEMVLNDPFIGANLKMISTLGSKGEWRIDNGSGSKKDIKASELIYNILFEDMDHSFQSFAEYILSSEFAYGFGLAEVVYKKRTDGFFGIKKIARRYSSTIDSWKIDDKQNITAVIQKNPSNFKEYTLPYDKLLHFKIDSIDGSPEGMPLTRNCFTSYYTKKIIETDERVRIHKDARGMIICEVPNALLTSTDPKHVAFVTAIKKGLANISNSNDSYILRPAGDNFKIDTIKTSGSITQDTKEVIERCDRYIATSLLSDFILLGQKSGSANGIITAKTKIYSLFIGSLMDGIADVINKQLIPKLCELNNLKVDQYPKLKHANLSELAIESALALQSAGQWITSIGNAEQYNYIMKKFISSGFPEITDDEFKELKEGNKKNPSLDKPDTNKEDDSVKKAEEDE